MIAERRETKLELLEDARRNLREQSDAIVLRERKGNLFLLIQDHRGDEDD